MSKAKKTKPIAVKPAAPSERAQTVRRFLIHIAIAVVLVAASGIGLHFLRRHVETKLVFPARPPKVVLKNRPPWMSDFLADQIIKTVRPRGTHSALDHQMLVDAVRMLESDPKLSPWIRKINQVRRVYGEKPGDTLEIDCEYRAPIALVKWGEYFWLVDGEGVKLPEEFTADQVPKIVLGNDRRMNIRVIEGVQQPPVESGQKWPGEDLYAGLDLVKLLYGEPWADEIVKVDVSNHDGRRDYREAQLVLMTKYGSEIRWGRPIDAKDFFVEVSTSQKLNYLRDVYAEFRRVDGRRPWIDIRFDKITYPAESTAAAAAHSEMQR